MAEPEDLELLAAIERKRRELDALKKALARVRPTLPAVGSWTVLKCRIGEVAVALRVDQLREVVAMAALGPLPSAPIWVCGVLQIGAEQIVAVDLLARETGERRPLHAGQFLALLQTLQGPLAFVVDELMDFERLDLSMVQRPSEETPFAAHVVGVTRLSGQSFVLVDAEPVAGPALDGLEDAR